MKARVTVILAVSILFNIILGTLLFSSFKSYRNVKDSYSRTQSQLEETTAKYQKQQEINNDLYTDFKKLKGEKEKLLGQTKVLNKQNRSLNSRVSSLSSKLTKMHNRMVAGKKSSYKKSRYTKKSKTYKYSTRYKTGRQYKRCR
jgi:predicted nuclease with TOPRIM domain